MEYSRVRYPLGWIRDRYIEGLRFLAPFIITYFVGRAIFNLASDVMQPLFSDWFGHRIPGLGIGLIIGLPLIFGMIAMRLFGLRALAAAESSVERIPVVGPMFGVARQLISSFGASETGFQTVVEVEYPSEGLFSLGFLTDTLEHEDGEVMGVVYIPTAPTPNSGWLAIIPIENIRMTDLKVSDVMSTVFSAGVTAPRRITRRVLPPDIGKRLQS
ncbi:MAG: DUF502 domain-containing protein [Chloroflexi bacterium]|nr:DUF502 domain-containing protein [Chloroflexota bacterium]